MNLNCNKFVDKAVNLQASCVGGLESRLVNGHILCSAANFASFIISTQVAVLPWCYIAGKTLLQYRCQTS